MRKFACCAMIVAAFYSVPTASLATVSNVSGPRFELTECQLAEFASCYARSGDYSGCLEMAQTYGC